MINKKKKYIGRLTLAAAITSILFSGCGAAQKELAQTDRASYEKISYQTVTVQSGSLTPQTTISLSAQGYTRFFLWCDKHGAYARKGKCGSG